MIIEALLISQPYSGEYSERIYDKESVWNSQNWTFIKFTNDDYSEWCGQFRGMPRKVAISKQNKTVLVLTSDYLFQLDLKTANLIDIEDQPQYKNLTVAPNGDFILADYYNFDKITTTIKEKESIESPIQMDMIEFKKWDDEKLKFTCNEFLNWPRHLTMTYNIQTNKIEIKNG
ncbi:hypothetical protein [Chryseobacterium profundimaris]|uniref:Uncharacterized protein n=1 Tax=Chryseobacterium profundimaris TaxID=1387275 RepID=A0ABY1PI43_9FLAO|nr:hypothetical protein [Chryseobacterium profundimaris]SMP34910.1 hypothetical protein SAMN06264346_11931 [Chryseobacterium profundimaris]